MYPMTPRLGYGGPVKTVWPTPREETPPKERKPRKPLRTVEHRMFGVGRLRCVRSTDSGPVADVEFPDGSKRSLLVDAKFWLTPIDEITAAQPPTPLAITAAVENEAEREGERNCQPWATMSKIASADTEASVFRTTSTSASSASCSSTLRSRGDDATGAHIRGTESLGRANHQT